MAITIQFRHFQRGSSLTMRLFPLEGGLALNGAGDAATAVYDDTEVGNDPSLDELLYEAVVTESVPVGNYVVNWYQSGHLVGYDEVVIDDTSGTFYAYQGAALAWLIPSVNEISESVNNILSVNHGSGIWQDTINTIDIASGVWDYNKRTLTSVDVINEGYVPITITTQLSNGDIVGQVRVEVTPDATPGDLIVAGYTDQIGTVKFFLESGNTYYFWRYKNGYQFSNPKAGFLNGEESITWE